MEAFIIITKSQRLNKQNRIILRLFFKIGSKDKNNKYIIKIKSKKQNKQINTDK